MKNTKHRSFGAGRAGHGQIDLQNGKLEFIHNDTSSDSNVLPISISHVYSTVNAKDPELSLSCGKGFRLNIHQKLKKDCPDDPKDTRYTLYDAAGNEYGFEEKYYYLNEGKRIYHKLKNGEKADLTPKDIRIDYEGKLTYKDSNGTKHEIFTELRTNSGLLLRTELKAFRGSKRIETRHEELIQMEEEVKSLERSIEDLEFAKSEYGKLTDEDYLYLKEKQEEIQTRSIELEQVSRDSFRRTCGNYENSGRENCKNCPNNMKESCLGGIRMFQEDLIGLSERYNELIRKEDAAVGGLILSGPNNENDAMSGEMNADYIFGFNANRSRFTYADNAGKAMEKLSLLASYHKDYNNEPYGLDNPLGAVEDRAFDAQGNPIGAVSGTLKNSRKIMRVIRFLQERFNEMCERKAQDMRDTSSRLEKKRWEEQKHLMEIKEDLLSLQELFQDRKRDYDEDEEERMKERYSDLTERADLDIRVARKMLGYRRFMLSQYEEQVPVNYIIDQSNLTYGFNRSGGLVAIWDAYGNYVSLTYENGDLVRITDAEEKEIEFEYVNGKLETITDTLDRQTKFEYNNRDQLEKIIYPDGDSSSFGYQDDPLCGEDRLLRTMIPPTGIGTKVRYDPEGRPIRITDITTTDSIDYDGLKEKSGPPEEEDAVNIAYDKSGRSSHISDPRTGHRTTYLFNSEEECITEYTELDDVMKSIRTYDVGRRRCYFTMQQSDFDKNLMDGASLLSSNNSIENPSGNGMRSNISGPGPVPCSAEWNIDPNDLPEYATDLILSGFATADSDETLDRRKTEYCAGHEHSNEPEDPSGQPGPAIQDRRFELRADVVYSDPSKSSGIRTKTFIASFDHKIKTEQFAAVPVTLDENDFGEPIRPQSVRITADYSNNNPNFCLFTGISLADGDWSYAEVDDENRKIFECGNHRISDRTEDGVSTGKFITYEEKFFEYSSKGNLTKETANVRRSDRSEPKTYETRYEYNKQSKLIRTTAQNGMVSETSYDKNGIAVKSFTYHKSNPACRFVRESEQNEKGQTVAEYDERGENKTTMKYLDGTNIVTGSVAPDGQEFASGIDPHTGDLLAISSSVNGEPNETKFAYKKGMLTRLTSGGTNYDYSYDQWGRRSSIRIADEDKINEPHVKFTFETVESAGDDDGNEILITEYANGERYETATDRFGKLLTVHRVIRSDDGAGNISTVRTPFIRNIYDNDDKLIKTVDHISEKVTEYVYNEDGSINTVNDGDLRTTTDYNADGSVKKVTYALSDDVLHRDICEQTYENVYDEEDGKLSQIILPDGSSESAVYDDLGRVTEIQHTDGSQQLTQKKKISYYQNGDNATNIIISVRNGRDSTKYAYDKRGNISEIFENGKLSVRYRYDGLSRLIREDNIRLNKTFTTEYDNNGNILFKNTYPLTSASEPAFGQESDCGHIDTSVHSGSSYEYCEEGNRDRLLRFSNGNGNGNSSGQDSGSSVDGPFEYDILGNPTRYRNKSLLWDRLRNLAQFGDIRFDYDATGLRTSKYRSGGGSSNGPGNGNGSCGNGYDDGLSVFSEIRTKFYWAGDKLLAERRISRYEDLDLCNCSVSPAIPCDECADHENTYLTDAEDTYCNVSATDIAYVQGVSGITGFIISKDGGQTKETYWYRKNVQGDITHILDGSGIIRAEYIYDAWGSHKVLDENGNEDTDINFIGNVNAFRYRSYYYDIETDLYYLRSRYYDPRTGRFINADSISILDDTQTDINGLNLYAYCSNNPIMFFDPTGRSLTSLLLGGLLCHNAGPVVAASNWISDNIISPAADLVQVALAVHMAMQAKLVCWVHDNWEAIVGVAIIAVLVAATILSAGTLLAPVLMWATIGAGVGGTFGGISAYLNGTDVGSGFLSGVITGAAAGASLPLGGLSAPGLAIRFATMAAINLSAGMISYAVETNGNGREFKVGGMVANGASMFIQGTILFGAGHLFKIADIAGSLTSKFISRAVGNHLGFVTDLATQLSTGNKLSMKEVLLRYIRTWLF